MTMIHRGIFTYGSRLSRAKFPKSLTMKFPVGSDSSLVRTCLLVSTIFLLPYLALQSEPRTDETSTNLYAQRAIGVTEFGCNEVRSRPAVKRICLPTCRPV
jgi:hypothetical protein